LIDRPEGIAASHAADPAGLIEIGPSTIDGKRPVEFVDQNESSGGLIGIGSNVSVQTTNVSRLRGSFIAAL
jgi:hypothetical protein